MACRPLRGTPQIEVTFDLDANGVLNVTAKDLGSNKEHKIRIENSNGMNSEEIEKMKRDAELHADEDKAKRELADARVHGQSMIHQIERSMKDLGEKVTEADKAPINAAIAKVNAAVAGSDVAAIKAAVGELEQASQAMAQHVYAKAAPSGAEGIRRRMALAQRPATTSSMPSLK